MGEDGSSETVVPPVRFQIATVKVASMDEEEAKPTEAQGVLPEIRSVMQSFYREAFLDPANWKTGDYGPALERFTPEAAAKAKEHLDVLTLGADAGDNYDDIKPKPSLLGLRVLVDDKGEPVSAFALVTFAADASTSDGEPRKVVSKARFALEPSADGWLVNGFSATREDDTYGASPSPSSPPSTELGGPITMGRAHPAESFPAYDGADPLFFLVIGDSYRAGQSHLADSLHIVALDPETGTTTIVGIPRDSWVPIPGEDEQKINAALAIGGPDLMIETVEQLTGLKMDYYAMTTFEGFKSLVKDVGGLDIDIPYPIHDSGSKANFDKGPARLSGKEALRLARSRYDVPNGDFSRQHNEGLILLALLDQFQRVFRDDPSAMLNWMGTSMLNVETDLSWDEVMALGYLATRIRPADTTNIVMPGKISHEGLESTVKVDVPASKDLFQDLSDGKLDSEHVTADV
jgi:LCP family protein required for cell wall assembly